MRTALVTLAIFLFANVCSANVLGDTNGDGKVDLAEAIYALQVAAGTSQNLPEYCSLTMSGTWTIAQNYEICSVVNLNGTYYVAAQTNTATEVNKPPNSSTWAILAIQGTTSWNDLPGVTSTTSKVGIGTTNPTHELSVNGTIQAKELIVETGWADYVFEEGYNLKSLTDLEKEINKLGHLPNMPSAKNIRENGVKLGGMQTKMLEKIEELTLYLIKKDKILSEQQTNITHLIAENESFKKRLLSLEKDAKK